MATRTREAAVAASEQSCPRCGAARDADQEYCIECGLRLPAVEGRLASLRRGWLTRIGWYPGDWVWFALLALVAAGAGTAAAIVLTRDHPSPAGTTIVARAPIAPGAAAASPAILPAAPEPGLGGTTTTATGSRPATTAPNGRLAWPADRNGWTIVLISYPTRLGRSTPLATAIRAAGLGLPEVGVLRSSEFASLHPGYYVVFSGVYSSRADAEAALASARATGFGGAYTRQIAR